MMGAYGDASRSPDTVGLLMCMLYSLGNLSGAHFSTPVTDIILLSGGETIAASMGYRVAGGFTAFFSTR